MRKYRCIVLFLLTTACPFILVDAEEPVGQGTIVVTAQKIPDTQQNVPLSLTVLEADFLQASSIHTIKEASYFVPNLHIAEFSARRTSFPFIRGIGSGLGDPAVTTMIDGVPQLTPNTTDMDFIDVERIEFIRGPQGTLYGRNTLGGVINIITRQPSAEKSAKVFTEIGEFDYQRYHVMFNTPLHGDQVLISMGGGVSRREGFTRNTLTGNDVDDQDARFLHGQLLLRPHDDLIAKLSIHAQQDRDGGFTLFDLGSLRRDPFDIMIDYEGSTERDVFASTLSISHHGEAIEFDSITAYQDWDAYDLTDLDFTALDLLRREVREEQQQFYQEFRIHSSEGAGLKLSDNVVVDWLLGLSLYSSQFTHNGQNEYRPAFSALTLGLSGTALPSLFDTTMYDLDDQGISLFGQKTLTIGDDLDLTFGLRYEFEEKEADIDLASAFIPAPFDIDRRSISDDFDQWLPRVGLSHRCSDEILGYVSAAKSYRSGGYNRNTIPGGPFTYMEEESWSYETGVKTTWNDQRVTINVALFYIDWTDRQLEVPNPMLPGSYYLDNVGESSSQGVELETLVTLTDELSFQGGVGYAQAEFDAYRDPISGTAVDDKKLPGVPEFTWNTVLQYEKDLKEDMSLFARAEAMGVGRLFYDSANTVSQNTYVIANLRAGIKVNQITMEGWIRNAFDEAYIPLAIPSPFSPSGYVGRMGDPRMAGISLGLLF